MRWRCSMGDVPQAYRADHVGSLLRPPELLQARADHQAGRITRDQLTEIEDACVLKALDLQRQVGISVFTEGEYRRSGWSMAIRESVEGLLQVEAERSPIRRIMNAWQGPHGDLANAGMAVAPPMVAGKIRQVRRLAGTEAAFLKAHAPGPW